MNKIRAIAMREYLASVRTKAFLITILLMPILMGGSLGVQLLFKQLDDAKEKKYALIDRTPGQKLAKYLSVAVVAMQMAREKEPELGSVLGPRVTFVDITPSEPTPEAMAQQRYEISQQIEKGELEALVEIGPKVVENQLDDPFPNPDRVSDEAAVRIQAKGAGALQFRRVLEVLLNQGVQQERFEQKGLSLQEIAAVQQRVPVKVKSLTQRDTTTGQLSDAADETRLVNLILPGILIALMFMVTMVGATPAMHTIIEEKSLRIAEVLLGSVTPFQLMAGKLLGVIGVALTMAIVYLSGGYAVASYYGFLNLLPLDLLLWFFPMMVLALLIYGSLFLAVGAAASDIKDTQTLLMPIMMLACIPFFALGPIIQDPNGPIARICSFFPFATPMLLVARQSVPPGVPLWEMLLGIALVLVTTLACVWAAGRIFRVGILLQGKTPSFGDLVQWVIRG